MAKIYLILFLLSSPIFINAQEQSSSQQKVNMAIDLMENGNPDEAIIMLDEAKKLDPQNYIYDYEKAFAYYIKKDYKKAIKIYNDVLKYDNANDQCYQMLGNLYDLNGKSGKALDVYDKGLKKFPNSGRLYLEKGNVYWIQQKYNEALFQYELGIEKDPGFASNYYRASLLFCGSTESVWGMVFGEIFINLERNSKRTKEISKLLYNTYKSQITFTSDTSISVSFSKNATISIDDLKDPENFKLSFGVGLYEPLILLSATNEKGIDLASLNRIRSSFIGSYYKGQNEVKYPNVLFAFNRKISDAGHFEAYNYWLLRSGEEEGFNSWKTQNPEKWDQFVNWFNENELTLNAENKIVRR